MIVREDRENTNGNYQCRGIAFSVGANQTEAHEVSWPFNVRLGTLRCLPFNDGDEALAVAGEDTTIGAITSDVSANDTVINVSDTVIQYIQVGFRFKLDDGTNNEEFWVTAIDEENKKVTINSGTVNGYSASTPTACKMTIRMTYDYVEFRADDPNSCGDSFLGGSLLTAGAKLKIYYKNNSASAIRPRIKVEYWY